MFEMFSLRRPDVLPVGDLGVQKGLLRWVLAAHAPGSVNFVKTPLKAKAKTPVKVKHESPATPPPATLMAFPPTPLSPREDFKPVDLPITPGPHASTATVASAVATPSIPPAHLIARPEDDGFDPHFSCPLPDGLTVEVLKSRLAGKKVKWVLPMREAVCKELTNRGGAYLTPAEMDALTAPWRPYRSLGVFYLWAVTEPES
jgi:DNA-3-methyladenine glycosylase II